MKSLNLIVLVTVALLLAGCSGAPAGDQPLPVNTGAGTANDPMQDPTSDAGVATDPSLMAPATSE